MNRRTLLGVVAFVLVPKAASAQRWSHAEISNIDFRAQLPVSFGHAFTEAGETTTWRITAPDGRPFVGVHAGSSAQAPSGEVPASARRVAGRRYGRPYYLHVWTFELPAADAELAGQIAATVQARR